MARAAKNNKSILIILFLNMAQVLKSQRDLLTQDDFVVDFHFCLKGLSSQKVTNH